MRWGAAAAVLLIVVVASLALNVYQYASPKSLTVTTTAATTTGLPSATCSEPAANVTGAFSTDCRLGITLGLSASPAVTEGSNQTVQVLLKNDLPTSNQAKYTGLPALPHGLGPLNDTFENYILPEVLDCGTSAPPDSGLASIAVYDASGFPLQLNVMEPCLLAQASAVSPPFQFNASQTISVHISLGGYWTSTDRSEPWINATYHRFAPGAYTIVAFDPWKQLAELNFTVSSTATPPAAGQLYEVTFKQSGDCTPAAYAAPWSVTLGPWTVVEPSNASLPIDTRSGSARPSYVNYSVITFSVPNGEYRYSIAVGWVFANPSGLVNVNRTDVTVLLQGPEISCTMTTAAG